MNNNDWLKDNYYDLLGINQIASDEEITRAYRNKAKELHPDKYPIDSFEHGQAQEKFKNLLSIKEILLDKQKRSEYDNKLLEEQQIYLSFIANEYIIKNQPKEAEKPKTKSFKDILKEKMQNDVLNPTDSFTFSNQAKSYYNEDDELTKEEKAKKYKKEGAKKMYDLGIQALKYGDMHRAMTYFKSAQYLDPSIRVPTQYFRK